jgi:hypothetical protein
MVIDHILGHGHCKEQKWYGIDNYKLYNSNYVLTKERFILYLFVQNKYVVVFKEELSNEFDPTIKEAAIVRQIVIPEYLTVPGYYDASLEPGN